MLITSLPPKRWWLVVMWGMISSKIRRFMQQKLFAKSQKIRGNPAKNLITHFLFLFQCQRNTNRKIQIRKIVKYAIVFDSNFRPEASLTKRISETSLIYALLQCTFPLSIGHHTVGKANAPKNVASGGGGAIWGAFPGEGGWVGGVKDTPYPKGGGWVVYGGTANPSCNVTNFPSRPVAEFCSWP